MAIDPLPGCAFVHSTQASTMALAVSALMTAFIKVRLATSEDTVTLLNGAGVVPCAHPSTVPNTNAIMTTRITAKRNNPVCFRMFVFPLISRKILCLQRSANFENLLTADSRQNCHLAIPGRRDSTPHVPAFARFFVPFLRQAFTPPRES